MNLKDLYSQEFLEQCFREFKSHAPSIRRKDFFDSIQNSGWDQLELKQRMRQIAKTTREILPGNYPEQLKILVKITEDKILHPDGHMNFVYMYIPDFVEQFGQEHVQISLKAMEKITCFTSCEFAIRPYILKYPDKLIPQMIKWSKHKHPMVRRLASEGCRPRLPWAMALPFLKKDPGAILPVLENLKSDPSETVRRSVANNLNDIAKDHPEVLVKITKQWFGKTDETDRLLKHACRTLLKKAHPEILRVFSLDENIDIKVKNLKLKSDHVKIGDTLEFDFELFPGKLTDAKVRIEYIIRYAKSGGKYSDKIFQAGELKGIQEKKLLLRRKQSLKDMTTRKHYPGAHRLSIRINGKEKAATFFHLSK